VHDAGHGLLQPLPALARHHEPHRPLDLPALRPVLRSERRGAAARRLCAARGHRHRRHLRRRPRHRQILRRPLEQRRDALRTRRAEIPRLHARAAGRRRARHVRDGLDARHLRGRARAQHRAVRRADLRADRPDDHQDRAHEGRRDRAGRAGKDHAGPLRQRQKGIITKRGRPARRAPFSR